MVAEGAAKEAKAEGTGEEDPSMEEILHSIRRIIAEDGEETKGAVSPEAAKEKPANGAAPAAAEPAAATGSDVLELTEMVKEEAPKAAPVVEAAPAAAPPAAPAGDVLSKIDEALGHTPAAPAAPTVPKDTLLSEQAATAAVSSLQKLKVEEPMPPLVTTPSPAFGSGNTVENMVIQMLKPMVKEWLDNNLPAIVERIVEREVRKLTRQ